jgi:hypothetical protein
MKFQIKPVREDFLVKVRNYGLDDQNQPVERFVAEGGEPCRDVLRRARQGEGLILASYCPFSRPGPYKEYGPVFVLAEADGHAPTLDELPLPQSTPTDYLAGQFVLRAYDAGERIVDATLSTPQRCERDLERLFGNPGTAFVLVRFAAYGCYALRVERVEMDAANRG